MTPSNPEKTPTVVVAHRGRGNHLANTFLDLIPWFKNVIVAGSEDSNHSQVIREKGGTWVACDSPHIVELWEAGMKTGESDWYLLIQSTEYLSTVLKESIAEIIQSARKEPGFYPFARLIFFLKQRLKYNLEWTHDPPSGLLFAPTHPVCLDELIESTKAEPPQGELVHFAERTLNEAIQNSIHRAERLADLLFKKSPDLNKRTVAIRAVKCFITNFITTYLFRKGMREGYEGLVFCILDSAVILLGFLRYYDKYIRSGKQIEHQRNSIKKILVIKVRGLGDAVLATPVLKNLKTLMPDVSVSVLTFNFCKPLFKNNPNVSELYGLSEKPEAAELGKLASALSEQNFDLIINLHARNLSSKLASKIKSRWTINSSYFIREKHTDVLIGSYHELDKNSVERDLDCLRAIGLEPINKEPELFTTEEEVQWAQQKLKELKVDSHKKLIMIHPACSQAHKNWGMKRFVQLSRHLINDCGHQVMGIFSEQEQSVANSLQKQVDGIFVYTGPIGPSMAIIQQSDLMIDNCSGPSHISAAFKVPTLVLMGVDYKNTYRADTLYKDKHFLFFREVPCRDLLLSKCLPPNPCQDRICMDHSIEEVLAKAQELLCCR